MRISWGIKKRGMRKQGCKSCIRRKPIPKQNFAKKKTGHGLKKKGRGYFYATVLNA